MRAFEPSFATPVNPEDQEEKERSLIHTTFSGEVLTYIFAFLPPFDQAKSREVCFRWKTLIDDEKIPQLNSLRKFILGKVTAHFIQTQNYLFNTQNAPLLIRAVIEENDPLSFTILRPQLLEALTSSQESKDLLTRIIRKTPFDVKNFLKLIENSENHSNLKKHLAARNLLAGDAFQDPTIEEKFLNFLLNFPQSSDPSQEDLYLMLNFGSILTKYFHELLFRNFEETPNKKEILQKHILHAKQPFWFAYLPVKAFWNNQYSTLACLNSEACKEVNPVHLERFMTLYPSFTDTARAPHPYYMDPLIHIYDKTDNEERGISFLSSIKEEYSRQRALADFYHKRGRHKEASDIYGSLLKKAPDIISKYDLVDEYCESLLRAPYDKEKYVLAEQTLDKILDYASKDDSLIRSSFPDAKLDDTAVEEIKQELLTSKAYFRFYAGENGLELAKLLKKGKGDIDLFALTRAIGYRGWQNLDKEVQSSFHHVIKKKINKLYKKQKYEERIQTKPKSVVRWYKEEFLPNIDLWKEILSTDTKASKKFNEGCAFLKNLIEPQLKIE